MQVVDLIYGAYYISKVRIGKGREHNYNYHTPYKTTNIEVFVYNLVRISLLGLDQRRMNVCNNPTLG